MKKPCTIFVVIGIILMVALAFPLMGECAAVKSDTYTFTVSWLNWSPYYRCTQIFKPGGEFQRMLYERSGGRIKLNIVNKMFPSKEVLPAVIEGRADIGEVMMPNYSATYPYFVWGDVPGILSEDPEESRGEQLAVFQDPNFLKIWDKKHRELGLVHLFIAPGGSGNLLCAKKPVTKLGDMKGLKTRVYGFTPTMGIKAFGGISTPIALEEVETALLTGTVDAVLTGPLFANSIGLAKLAPYMTFTPLSPTWVDTCAINAKKFDSLPPDLQKVMRDVGREVEQMISMANTGEIIMALQSIKNANGKILSLEKAEQAKALELVAPIEAEWLKIAGPVGKEMLTIAKDVIRKYRAFETTPKK